MGIIYNGQPVGILPGSDTVDSSTIIDNTITSADILDDTLTASDIAADAVGLSELAVPAAKGGLLTHDGATQVELAVGADNFVLTADSASPDGVKWAAPGSASLARSFTTYTTTATLTGADDFVLLDSTGGAFTLSLPAAPSDGDFFDLKKIAGGAANLVTIDGNGNTIDGAATQSLKNNYENYYVTFSTANSEWYIA